MICLCSSCHPTISCFIKFKIHIGSTFLMPTYQGCPGKEAAKLESRPVCYAPLCKYLIPIAVFDLTLGLPGGKIATLTVNSLHKCSRRRFKRNTFGALIFHVRIRPRHHQKFHKSNHGECGIKHMRYIYIYTSSSRLIFNSAFCYVTFCRS